MRRVIVGLIAVALAAGVVALWPRSTSDDPPTTIADATTTTTSSTPTSTSTTTTLAPDTTTTATPESHVVETVEEAEAILRELWFGWFEGIYNQDEDRIREVVGNPDAVAAAVDQFGEMEFESPPTSDAVEVQDIEILRTDRQCLAVWAQVTSEFREGSIEGVHVFRPRSDQWLLINTWQLRGDLWEADCDAVLRS